jgi:hypothetical protein
MGMYVEVINVTDGPGHSPEQLDIYNKTLNPGESIKIPAELVDEKLRRMADGEKAKIAIGQAPSWYLASKLRRGKELTKEEIAKHLASRVPKPTVVKSVALALVTEVKPPTDEIKLEEKAEAKQKRR